MVERNIILAECRKMFNDICIVGDTNIGRLIGFHEDENDYYYHILYMKGKTRLHSAVGPCISLKGIYPRYKQIDKIFSLNGAFKKNNFYRSNIEENGK